MATTTVQAAPRERPGPTRLRTGPARRLPWWSRELALLVGVYVVYSLGRLVVGADVGTAMDRGAELVTFESQLSWLSELRLNQALQSVPVLAVAAAYWYSLLHYTVTPVVLVWLRRRHTGSYGPARTALVVATLLGLVGFWLYPTAPPRMLADQGFVDTLASFSDWGWWSTDASAPKGLGGLTNEFAAMPSLHVGWAVWVGWYAATHARRTWVRVAAVSYPLVTTLVVVATANHYWADGVAAAVLAAGAVALVGATTEVAVEGGQVPVTAAPADAVTIAGADDPAVYAAPDEP
jgi:hypothetical protein